MATRVAPGAGYYHWTALDRNGKYCLAIDEYGNHGRAASAATNSMDTGLGRIGAASLAIGNGTAGDYSGTLKLTKVTFADGSSLTTGSETSRLDSLGTPAQGDILYRGASGWTYLTPGTSGQFLQTQGASANPQWATPSGSGNVLTSGTITTGQVATWASSTSIQSSSASAVLDTIGSAVQGDVLYRDASGWAFLAPGTSGTVLQTQGSSANPKWSNVALAGTSGKTLTINNSLTLAGTDATTMTFPATSDTVAGIGTAQTWTAAQTHSANIVLANPQVLQWKNTSGTAINCVQLDSGNNLNFGSSGVTGNTYFYPGSGRAFRFQNAAATAYFMSMQDGSNPQIGFGTNSYDGKFTFWDPTATTGDTSFKIRDGAARGSHIDFGNSSGTYDVGLAHAASGYLTVTQGGTTFTNYGGLVARSVVTPTSTYANLPSSPSTGCRACISDSTLAYNSTNLGTTAAGGGSNFSPVIYNGSNWIVGG